MRVTIKELRELVQEARRKRRTPLGPSPRSKRPKFDPIAHKRDTADELIDRLEQCKDDLGEVFDFEGEEEKQFRAAERHIDNAIMQVLKAYNGLQDDPEKQRFRMRMG